MVLVIFGCAAPPAFLAEPPRFEGGMAYERFVVAAGQGEGTSRDVACGAADDQARQTMVDLLEADSELRGEIIAAAGGPSRLRGALEALTATDGLRAVRSAEVYEHNAARCYVELRWLLPRHLDVALRRTLSDRPEEDLVGSALREALRSSAGPAEAEGREDAAAEDAPVGEASAPAEELDAEPAPAGVVAAPSAFAALAEIYPGWYVRILPRAPCDGQLLAFVGAPGGTEARWVWLERDKRGVRIVSDQRLIDGDWPAAPSGCR